jgi:hypothetical protein
MDIKKALLSAMVVALFVGDSVEGVQLKRHGNFSAGKDKQEDSTESTFLQTSFVGDPDETQAQVID